MTDKLNENEHSTRHDVIQHGLASNKDHLGDVGMALLERNMSPQCKFKYVYLRKVDSVGLTSNIIEP